MATTTHTPRFILVTGAAGRIGSYFTKNANKQKYKLRLMVCIEYFYIYIWVCFVQVHPSNPSEEVELLKPYGEVIEAELENAETLLKACEGVDTILHLAGEAHPNPRWESLLKNNIEGYSFS